MGQPEVVAGGDGTGSGVLGKEVGSIELVVAEVLIHVAVQPVGPGLGHDVQDAATGAAKLRGGNGGDDAELIDDLDGRRKGRLSLAAESNRQPIQQDLVRAGDATVGLEIVRRRSNQRAAGGTDTSAEAAARRDPRREGSQAIRVSAVQRKVADLLGTDDEVEGCVVGVELRSTLRLNRDRLGVAAEFHDQIHLGRLADGEGEVRLGLLESGLGDLDAIWACLKRSEAVDGVTIRLRLQHQPRVGSRQRDCAPRKQSPGGVGDPAGDASGRDLGVGEGAGEKEQQRCQEELAGDEACKADKNHGMDWPFLNGTPPEGAI